MNNYQLLELAGVGGYGRVFKARNLLNGNLVAVKQFVVYPIASVAHEEVLYKVLGRHPNIVYMIKRIGICLILEYIHSNFREFLDSNPNELLLYDLQIHLCTQLIKAVYHCHRKLIIHRDIRPENLLITAVNHQLKLTDFNCACFKTTRPLSKMVNYHTYRAPELLLCKEEFICYNYSVDIWSSGCVFAEILCNVHDSVFVDESCITEEYVSQLQKRHPLLDMCLQLNPVERVNSEALLEFIVLVDCQWTPS